MATTNRWNNLMQSFDNLKSANIDGLTQEDIETERNNANDIRNIATSKSALQQASVLGIDPGTENYNIFVALKDHHSKLLEEADKNLMDAELKLQNIINSEDVNK